MLRQQNARKQSTLAQKTVAKQTCTDESPHKSEQLINEQQNTNTHAEDKHAKNVRTATETLWTKSCAVREVGVEWGPFH